MEIECRPYNSEVDSIGAGIVVLDMEEVASPEDSCKQAHKQQKKNENKRVHTVIEDLYKTPGTMGD